MRRLFSSPVPYQGSIRAFAIPIALVLPLLASAVQAQSIDTALSWDGTTAFHPFGLPDTATYGQTITSPAQPATLKAFDFRINPHGVAFPFKFYVYEWDPLTSRPVGIPLYASPIQTTEATDQFQALGVSGLNITLFPGKQYVLFASVSETPGPAAGGGWGAASDSTYANGSFVYINNGSDTSRWTSEAWTTVNSYDSAFVADIQFQGLPAAPALAIASLGDGQASFGLSLSDSGSAPLQQYDVHCEPRGDAFGVSVSGASSPVAMTGLSNGISYDCTATATNTNGLTGPESNVVTVTPRAAPVAPQPVQTLSQWGSVLISGLLAVVGMLGMGRVGRRRG